MCRSRILAVVTVIISAVLILLVMFLPPRDILKMTFSEKINAGILDDINIVINGDSIGGTTDEGEWCKLLQEKLHDNYNCTINIHNISKPGNGTFAGIVSWQHYIETEGGTADLVILCYGENDNEESFKYQYEALIRNTIKYAPNCEIIAILQSSQKTYTNKINAIIDLCDYYGINYVDTIEAFNKSGYAYKDLSDDGIHPNSLGKSVYANAIYDTISNKLVEKQHIWDFKGERAKARNEKYKESSNYDRFKYISNANMLIEKQNVIVQIPDCSVIGLDMEFSDGKHEIFADLNGDKYDLSYTWNYGFNQRHIYQISDKQYNNVQLSISFGDSMDVQNLHGVILFF